ncbi:MAG: Ig-like domain-containing protein [Clostridia bacterium]|nr:Ig-like domain-containing protein [Clostridia bacterium]
MKKKFIFSLFLIVSVFFTIFFVACKQEKNVTLSLDKEQINLDFLQTVELEIEYNGENELVWETDDSSVATVDKNGIITGVGEGCAIITVKSGNLNDSVTVNVSQPNLDLFRITSEEQNIWLYGGQKQNILPKVLYGQTEIQDVQFIYAVHNQDLISVSDVGEVSAKQTTGYTTVDVTAEIYGKELAMIVGVTVQPISEIVVNKEEFVVCAGVSEGQSQYENTVTPIVKIKEKEKIITDAMPVYTSSDQNIFTVSGGVISGVNAGSAYLKLSYIGSDGIEVTKAILVKVVAKTNKLTTVIEVNKEQTVNLEQFISIESATIEDARITDGTIVETVNVQDGFLDFTQIVLSGEQTLQVFAQNVTYSIPIYLYDKYLEDATDLAVLKTATDDHYKIVCDIDMDGQIWNGIKSVFKGVLNGNGCTIYNFGISKSGLFDKIGGGATIKNLTFSQCVIQDDAVQTGVVASCVEENANVTLQGVNIRTIVNGENCGGVFGVISKNSKINLIDSTIHSYSSKVSLDKGAIVSSADSGIIFKDSIVFSSLPLCGQGKISGINNSAITLINASKVGIQPIEHTEKVNIFDLFENDKTLTFTNVSNCQSALIVGSIYRTIDFNGQSVTINKEDVEGFVENRFEVLLFNDNDVVAYYSVITYGDLKIRQENVVMMKTYAAGKITLVENIDLAGIEWDTQIKFNGVFDGGNYSISNLTTTANAGLFKSATGTIKNVIFKNVELSGGMAGTIASSANTLVVENTFIQIDSISNINAWGSLQGGIVERINAGATLTLRNCLVTIPQGVNPWCGMVCGYQMNVAEITNCYFAGGNGQFIATREGAAGSVTEQSSYTFFADNVELEKAINEDKTVNLPQNMLDAFNSVYTVLRINQQNVNKLLTLKGNETVYLTEDIDLSGFNWETSVEFSGIFDGQNHIIKNLSTVASNGFFKSVNNGVIKNVAFTNVSLASTSGAICYRPTGKLTVENVFIHVIKTEQLGRVGAICERSDQQVALNVKDTVICMPNTNSNASVFGYQIRGTTTIENLYCVGLADRDESISNVSLKDYLHKDSIYAIYPDKNSFVEDLAQLNLNTFLQGCAQEYIK